MPSTTRGSILISTANDIGEALVEKLGGVGYSPNEWKDKFNLCGIAPVDSAPALSVLADSAGTGDERGSILIATADAIGAILNKKYNVLRGFKPKEWASACRKMKALEEGSVASSSIASFSDGADDVPTKSLVVTIPPTLSGVSTVTETQTGRNLLNGEDAVITTNNIRFYYSNGKYYSAGTYTLSISENVSGIYVRDVSTSTNIVTKYNSNFVTFTLTEKTLIGFDFYKVGINQNDNIMLEFGSTAHAYEPYTTPKTYTASLGRTIYGGEVDIVNGVGQENCSFPTLLSSLTWSKTTISGHDAFYANLPDGYMGQGSGGLDGDCDTYAITTDENLGTDKTIRFYYNANFNISRCVIRDDQYASLTGAQFKETVSGNIVYELAESAQTDFTFEPVKIDSLLGVNNIWNDSGDTAVEYYQAPTPYARKTATGGIANFSDQRTDLPLTKAIANIAPSIAGKSAVNLYQGKKNLFDGTLSSSGASYIECYGNIHNPSSATTGLKVKAGVTYTISFAFPSVLTNGIYGAYVSDKTLITLKNNSSTANATATFTAPQDDELCFWVYFSSGSTAPDVSLVTCQVEVGSSSSAYVPYQDPTTYTAELGETVYGGSVDFVSGEVQKTFALIDLGSLTYTSRSNVGMQSNGVSSLIQNPPDNYTKTTAVASDYTADTWQAVVNGGTSSGLFGVSVGYICFSTTETDPAAFKSSMSGKYLVYPLATPTESAIPGRVISPIEGVNNYWNDAGGDTEIQYFEDET